MLMRHDLSGTQPLLPLPIGVILPTSASETARHSISQP
jgi:hypothetical protein